VDLRSAVTKVWVFYFHFLSWLQWVEIGLLCVVTWFLWVVVDFVWSQCLGLVGSQWFG
jgi:hypothetical protein